MSGISSQALSFGKYNKYRFNRGSEQQNKEFSDGSGLEWYATNFRMYDNQIGRWHVVDPLAPLNYSWSPYAYASNDPALLNDPYGLMSDSAHPVQMQEIKIQAPSKGASSSQIMPFFAKADHTGVASRAQPRLADNLRLIPAEEANAPFREPAYKPGTMVQRFNFNKQAFKGRFIRVFNVQNKDSDPFGRGSFLMRAEDAAGKTPQQIKDAWAIPGEEAPNEFVFVDVPNGADMQAGPAAENAFGNGQFMEYQLMEQIPNNSFSAPMPISEMPGIVMPSVMPNVQFDVIPNGDMPETIDPEIEIPR